MNEKLEEIIQETICDITQLRAIFETIALFTGEIFDDLLCIPEPNLKRYKNTFKTKQIKAYAVMDYEEKARTLLEKMDTETDPVFDYLIAQEAANNGTNEID